MSKPDGKTTVAAADGRSCRVASASARHEGRGVLQLIGAFLFCPCHLPLTLALAGMLLAGTAAGALLHDHPVAAGVVVTLALGIGANTTVFSVVNAVLLKPLSYPKSNELVSLQHVAPGLNSGALGLSPDLYFTYRDENRTFEHLGLFGDGGATVTGVGDPEQARIRGVSDRSAAFSPLFVIGLPGQRPGNR